MTMTKHLNVLMPDDLLAALDALATELGYTRSEFTRLLIHRAINGPEQYTAPTLPNWEQGAYTNFLCGIYGRDSLIASDAARVILDDTLAALADCEAQMLRWRFGLGGPPPHTRADVMAMTGMTREQVRQVEARALRRVRGIVRKRGVWALVMGSSNGQEADKE